MTDALHLRLPNALVKLNGDVPTEVRDGLVDLEDPRLRLDPSHAFADLRVSTQEQGWHCSLDSPALEQRSFSAGPGAHDLLAGTSQNSNSWRCSRIY